MFWTILSIFAAQRLLELAVAKFNEKNALKRGSGRIRETSLPLHRRDACFVFRIFDLGNDRFSTRNPSDGACRIDRPHLHAGSPVLGALFTGEMLEHENPCHPWNESCPKGALSMD